MDSTYYELYGDTCLRTQDGGLAGSTIRLIDAVRIGHLDVGLPLDECLRMASLYAARFIGSEGPSRAHPDRLPRRSRAP